MDINTLKVIEYKKCNIYVRNFKNVFEYIAIINGLVYTAHIVITKGFFQSLLGKPYTEKQMTDATRYLINTAEATVDYILEGKNKSIRK